MSEIINPNDMVLVRNTRAWELSFPSVSPAALQRGGGVILPPGRDVRVAYMDVEMQAQTPGSFFYGSDGFGTQAPVYIVDDKVRQQVYGAPAEEAGQGQLTISSVRELLGISPLAEFEKAMRQRITDEGDKRMLARLAVAAGLNDVQGGAGKKRAIEKYTGMSVVEGDEAETVVTTMRPTDA